jgi:hypothetical protein
VEDHPREDVCAAISATDPQTSVFTFASGLPVPAAILAVLDDTRPKTLERFDILPGTVKPLACPHSFSRGRLYVRTRHPTFSPPFPAKGEIQFTRPSPAMQVLAV